VVRGRSDALASRAALAQEDGATEDESAWTRWLTEERVGESAERMESVSSSMGAETEAGQIVALLEDTGTEALVEAATSTAAAEDNVVEADEEVVVEEAVKEAAEELSDDELVIGVGCEVVEDCVAGADETGINFSCISSIESICFCKVWAS
jgi:hypothetical protein